jgi:hypothetical protein
MTKSKQVNSSAAANAVDFETMMKYIIDMKEQFSLVSSQMKEHMERKNSEVANIEAAMREMCVKLNFYEQQSLNSMMDIDGLRFDDKHDLKSVVLHYIGSLGLEIACTDIINVFAFTKGHDKSRRKVLRVRFLHEFVKLQVMRHKIKMHKLTYSPVFFSHVLTRPNLQIIMQGKSFKKEKKISDIKLLSGRLYVFLLNRRKVLVEHMDDLFDTIQSDPPASDNSKCEEEEIASIQPDITTSQEPYRESQIDKEQNERSKSVTVESLNRPSSQLSSSPELEQSRVKKKKKKKVIEKFSADGFKTKFRD